MNRSISSRDNSWYKRFRKAFERHGDEIVIEGRKQITDSLADGVEVVAVAATDELVLADIPLRVPAFVFDAPLLRSLTDTQTPQGIVALCRRPGSSLERLGATPELLVILDAVQDPGNVGTLVRLAAAFSASGVVLTPGCADPFSPKSLRAAVGTTWLVPIVQTSTEAVLEMVERRRLTLLAADGNAELLFGSFDFPIPAALVLGNEGRGLSPRFQEAATGFRIDIAPRVESLNVAAAAAIVLHALNPTRRRRGAP